MMNSFSGRNSGGVLIFIAIITEANIADIIIGHFDLKNLFL